MNISEGIKRLEIVLYGAWTAFIIFLAVKQLIGAHEVGVDVFEGNFIVAGFAVWLIPIGTVWGAIRIIAWVVRGFFSRKDDD